MTIPNIRCLFIVSPAVSSAGATAEQDEKHRKEEHDGSGECDPNGGTVAGISLRVVVDFAANRGEEDKVENGDCEGNEEGKESEERGEDVAQTIGAQGYEEREKGEAARYGMEDQAFGEVFDSRICPVAVKQDGRGAGNVVADSNVGTARVARLESVWFRSDGFEGKVASTARG